MSFRKKAKLYLAKEQFEIFREIFVSVIISALITGIVTYQINKKIDNKDSQRKFIYEFSRTFVDNPKYRNISIALEEQLFYGREDRIKDISDYDLDDYLGLLSDIWTFYKEDLISKDMIDSLYSYYFCITSHSKLINEYRDRSRKEGFSEEYFQFLDEIDEELNLKNNDCKSI